eukprot:542049-Amphidinium_carterae.1
MHQDFGDFVQPRFPKAQRVRRKSVRRLRKLESARSSSSVCIADRLGVSSGKPFLTQHESIAAAAKVMEPSCAIVAEFTPKPR